MRKLLPALALVGLLAGCGGTGAHTVASQHTSSRQPTVTSQSPTLTPTPSPSPTKTSEPAIVVGLATTCDLLFNHAEGRQAVAQQAIAVVSDSPLTAEDYRKAGVLAHRIRDISVRAKMDLRPYLDAMSTALSQIHAETGATINLRDFQAAGLELINRCRSYIR